jgi:hypothetical protein
LKKDKAGLSFDHAGRSLSCLFKICNLEFLSCLFKKLKSLSLSCLFFSKKWNQYLCLVSSFSCIRYICLFSYLLNLVSSCRQMISHLACTLSCLFLTFFHQHKADENEREPLLPSPITDHQPQSTSTTTTDWATNRQNNQHVVDAFGCQRRQLTPPLQLQKTHRPVANSPTPSRTNRQSQSFKVRTLLVFKLSSHEYTVLTQSTSTLPWSCHSQFGGDRALPLQQISPRDHR